MRFRPIQLLRSRRLALALLLLMATWSFVGTLTVSEGFTRSDVFASPVMYVLTALLFASTVVCAWERTRIALRRAGKRGVVSRQALDRLAGRPRIVVETASSRGEELKDAEDALKGIWLRTVRGPRLLEGRSGRWGLAGSPLFHWSLAALIAVIALGQLTRAEGFMGVPVGSSRADVPQSYRGATSGPWFSGHTGLRVEVTDLVPSYMDGDVDRGPSPIVSLYDGDVLVASQRVFPNNPLRHGSLLIHMDDYGFAPEVVLLDSDGVEIAREDVFADFDDARLEGIAPAEFDLVGGWGQEPIPVTLQLSLPPEGSDVGRIELSYTDAAGETSVHEVELGEVAELPTGDQLVVEDVALYARLSVANDWSVPFIYFFFALAGIGITVAILVPHRRVLVLRHEGASGTALHVSARHSRGDPGFAERVEHAIRLRLGEGASHDR